MNEITRTGWDVLDEARAEAALEASVPAWTAVSADAESVSTPLPSGPMAPGDAAALLRYLGRRPA
jgi:hypothetical protein